MSSLAGASATDASCGAEASVSPSPGGLDALFGDTDRAPLLDADLAITLVEAALSRTHIRRLLRGFDLDSDTESLMVTLIEATSDRYRDDLTQAHVLDRDGLEVREIMAALERCRGELQDPVGSLSALLEVGLIDFDAASAAWWSIVPERVRPSPLLLRALAGMPIPQRDRGYALDAERVPVEEVMGSSTLREVIQTIPGLDRRWVVLRGGPGSGRAHVARAIATARRRHLLWISGALPAASLPVVKFLCRLWRCDPALDPTVPDAGETIRNLGWHGFGLVLLDADAPRLDEAGPGPSLELSLDPPTEAQRVRLWASGLSTRGVTQTELAHKLARAHRVGFGQIAQTCLSAREHAKARGAARPDWDDVAPLMRNHYLRLQRSFVEALIPRATLADLVLDHEATEQFASLVDACRSYEHVLDTWGLARRLGKGRGIAALFSGEPGTGKTLAVEVLATTLKRTLLKVDFANLVSKYVGETGKLIAEMFAGVDPLSTVLLFDEADALFQRRTEARSSNDKHANMDTNLLLQHVERFDGIVVLTTNLEAHLDPALRRRITHVIRFPQPGAQEQAAIWRRLVPDEVPLDPDVDFVALSTLGDLSGGHIKNCVLRALNAAWSASERPSMKHFKRAVIEECRALGRLVRDG